MQALQDDMIILINNHTPYLKQNDKPPHRSTKRGPLYNCSDVIEEKTPCYMSKSTLHLTAMLMASEGRRSKLTHFFSLPFLDHKKQSQYLLQVSFMFEKSLLKKVQQFNKICL